MARFLVIDDDSTMRDLVAITLQQAGHQVDQAASGGEAVVLHRRQPADVVITDIVMPGDSLGEVIALHGEFPDVPFVITSGLVANSPPAREMAQYLGSRWMLAKPFKLAELLGLAEAVLAEKKRAAFPAGQAPE